MVFMVRVINITINIVEYVKLIAFKYVDIIKIYIARANI